MNITGTVMLSVALCGLVNEARADVPISWNEPDEQFAREIATEWQAAVRDGKTDALVTLAGFDAGAAPYAQVTVPSDAKLAKKCGAVTSAKTAKAVRTSLPCLLVPDLVAALGGADLATASFSEKLSDVLVESKQFKSASSQLKKLDKTHAFITVTGIGGTGVWHQLVLAISVESATGTNRVGAVVHWTTKRE